MRKLPEIGKFYDCYDDGTHITDGIFKGPNDGGQWDTYEEALEAGIQKAIELI